MKVFISRKIPAAGIDHLINAGLSVTVWEEDRPLTQEELIEKVQPYDALICMNGEKINAHFLQSCSHLKVIALYSVGYDNIDLAAATSLKIPISNTPDVLSRATADTAFTLLLNVSRKAFFHHRRILNNQWDFFRPTANLGMELDHKTLGIFGLGRIGLVMAQRCKGAFNMNVIYHNRSSNPQAEKEVGARRVSFEELLAQSDVLSIHTSLTPETKGKFDKAVFDQMKPGSIFINTARGAIHNQQDLYDALQENKLWGAGLDVTNPEPMQPDDPLLLLPNVAVLPHIGSATKEARNGMAMLAAANVIAGLKSQQLPNIINGDVYK